jgi:anti-sigma28 factor (negative regulator of flagellin synthesis)
MRISALSEILNTELKKVESAKKAESSTHAKSVPIDKTELSSKGQRLNETKAQIDVIASKIAAEPDVRAEKITEAREKIRSGYYDSEDFLDKLTDKLMQEFKLK